MQKVAINRTDFNAKSYFTVERKDWFKN